MSCAYFVSDLHLKSPDEPKTKVFVRFLADLLTQTQQGSTEKPTHLFLVGDIFDLWIGSHEYFRLTFTEVVDGISRLVQAGLQVHFFEGNHDLYLKQFWHERLGVQVHRDAAYFDIDEKTVRIEHGDLINPDDKGYLFLRSLLRSPPMEFLARHLPSGSVTFIGDRASKTSRRYTSTAKELPVEKIRTLIRKHAETAFLEKPFDLIITGHVHVKDDFEFAAGARQARSVNLGSWYDDPVTFILSEQGGRFIPLSGM
jgi:UDP-2,3-diacylglucosamine hydrolase